MTVGTPDWADRLRQVLPTRASMTAHPWLRPVASKLLDPQLWLLQHEAVALGGAVGTFWASNWFGDYAS